MQRALNFETAVVARGEQHEISATKVRGGSSQERAARHHLPGILAMKNAAQRAEKNVHPETC
jgi:hypothetical protein